MESLIKILACLVGCLVLVRIGIATLIMLLQWRERRAWRKLRRLRAQRRGRSFWRQY